MTPHRRRTATRVLAIIGAVAPAASCLRPIDQAVPNTYLGHMAAFCLVAVYALVLVRAADRWLIGPAITDSITRGEVATAIINGAMAVDRGRPGDHTIALVLYGVADEIGKPAGGRGKRPDPPDVDVVT